MKDQDLYLSVIKFPAFVSISLLIISAVFLIILFNVFAQPLLANWVRTLFIILLAILIFVVLGWMITLFSTHTRLKPRWLQKLSKWMLFNIYYPLAKGLAHITFSSKKNLIESFLYFNNEIVLTDQKDIRNTNILVLLPHCLQKEDCTIRITNDIIKCEECGGCDIAKIKKLITEHNVDAAVATGGFLEHKMIEEKKPEVIVAIATAKELVNSLRDNWNYPVYAVLNEQSTTSNEKNPVNISFIAFAIKQFK